MTDDVRLTPVEARALGCLIEKDLATPDYYPMTIAALVQACNQKTSRDPVMALTEGASAGERDALLRGTATRFYRLG